MDVSGPSGGTTANERHRSEPELRAAIVQWLVAQGVAVRERVVCVAGEPDIVTADQGAIYEVKWRLTRKALHQAVGQVLLYRQCLNPHARAIVVGYATAEALALQPVVAAIGVEIWFWGLETGGGNTRTPASAELPQLAVRPQPDESPPDEQPQPAEPHPPSAPPDGPAQLDIAPPPAAPAPPDEPPPAPVSPAPIPPITPPLVPPSSPQPPAPSPQLHWQVARLARAQGLKNVPALAAAIGVQRQGLYGVWKDVAANVGLEMLARLARVLRAEPGAWFRWEAAPFDSDLVWRVRERAEAQGLNMSGLGFRVALHYHSLAPIWKGTAQFVFVETLARIALALGQEGLPFDVGAVLAWDDPRAQQAGPAFPGVRRRTPRP